MRRFIALALPALVATLPARSHACGGFFCSSQPIDQAGERIVYGLERDGTLTMAVQIQYSGDDDDFAWILPVPAPPEISLGTDALFDALGAATNPVFVTDSVTEGTCRSYPRCVYSDGSTAYTGGCGFGGGGGGGWTGGYVDAAASPPPPALADGGGAPPPDIGVTVFSQGPVGPYDTVVLGSTSAAEVVTWLREHDYDVPSESVPLLEAYEGSRQIFVALRLASNPETRQIRPIVLRMTTEEACLPIRLTAIATVPNMPITAYFLGETGVVPFNYSTAEPDLADLGFWRGTRSYANAVDEAVDALGGQAFVTEYAGPTPAVRIELPPVTDLAGTSDPAAFVAALSARGYPGDALLLELLERYLAPPSGEDAPTYYNCLAFRDVTSCGAPASFDPDRLAAAIEAQITAPRRRAQALVHRHGHLTRLFTTMDAAEMTIDPVFVEDAGAPEVTNVHRARLVTECSDDYYQEGAPTHWEVGGLEIPERRGTFADATEYCARFGAYPEGMAPSSGSRGTSCLCGVAGAGTLQWGALTAVGLIALTRRRRHR